MKHPVVCKKLFFSGHEGSNACFINIYEEKGQNVNRKSICTFCLSQVKKRTNMMKTVGQKPCHTKSTPEVATSSPPVWHTKSENNSNVLYHCASSPSPYYSHQQSLQAAPQNNNFRYQ